VEPEEYDNIAHLEERHWWYLGMRWIAADWLRRCVAPNLARAAQPPRLLDAGCGTGGGLRWLAAFGQVTGIDISRLALGYAAHASPRVTRGSVEWLPFSGSAFDVVTSFEVLYHLSVADDLCALRQFWRVLRPGGWLLLRLPAYDWLRGAHDRQVHTRHRYDRAELRHKLTAAGFEVHRLTHVGLTLVPPALFRRWRPAKAAPRSDVTLPPALANRLLTLILQAEGVWLARRDLPAGLSVLALARRSTEAV
jgi:SAM-dependent methyltransferase